MAAHLFNESGQMQEVDIPDIFDVLAGGEDESAVKLLLGFSAEDEAAVALMNENGGGLSITPDGTNTYLSGSQLITSGIGSSSVNFPHHVSLREFLTSSPGPMSPLHTSTSLPSLITSPVTVMTSSSMPRNTNSPLNNVLTKAMSNISSPAIALSPPSLSTTSDIINESKQTKLIFVEQPQTEQNTTLQYLQSPVDAISTHTSSISSNPLNIGAITTTAKIQMSEDSKSDIVTPTAATNSVSLADQRAISLTAAGTPRKRDPVDPSRCIYPCDCCGKAFTTKFNLKRHINMHCSPSKEAGVPLQGPPSASQPSRKSREKREAKIASTVSEDPSKSMQGFGSSSRTSINGQESISPLSGNRKSKRTRQAKKRNQSTEVTLSTSNDRSPQIITTNVPTIVTGSATLSSITNSNSPIVIQQSNVVPSTSIYQAPSKNKNISIASGGASGIITVEGKNKEQGPIHVVHPKTITYQIGPSSDGSLQFTLAPPSQQPSLQAPSHIRGIAQNISKGGSTIIPVSMSTETARLTQGPIQQETYNSSIGTVITRNETEVTKCLTMTMPHTIAQLTQPLTSVVTTPTIRDLIEKHRPKISVTSTPSPSCVVTASHQQMQPSIIPMSNHHSNSDTVAVQMIQNLAPVDMLGNRGSSFNSQQPPRIVRLIHHPASAGSIQKTYITPLTTTAPSSIIKPQHIIQHGHQQITLQPPPNTIPASMANVPLIQLPPLTLQNQTMPTASLTMAPQTIQFPQQPIPLVQALSSTTTTDSNQAPKQIFLTSSPGQANLSDILPQAISRFISGGDGNITVQQQGRSNGNNTLPTGTILAVRTSPSTSLEQISLPSAPAPNIAKICHAINHGDDSQIKNIVPTSISFLSSSASSLPLDQNTKYLLPQSRISNLAQPSVARVENSPVVFGNTPPAELFDSDDGEGCSSIATTYDMSSPPHTSTYHPSSWVNSSMESPIAYNNHMSTTYSDPFVGDSHVSAIKSQPIKLELNQGSDLLGSQLFPASNTNNQVVISLQNNSLMQNALGSSNSAMKELTTSAMNRCGVVIKQIVASTPQSVHVTPILGNQEGNSLEEEEANSESEYDDNEDEEDDDEDDEDDDLVSNPASLLPSNQFHGQLLAIPNGWLRKVVSTGTGSRQQQKVFYYNPVGKRFSNQDEIDQYFAKLGYSVGSSLFNFDPPLQQKSSSNTTKQQSVIPEDLNNKNKKRAIPSRTHKDGKNINPVASENIKSKTNRNFQEQRNKSSDRQYSRSPPKKKPKILEKSVETSVAEKGFNLRSLSKSKSSAPSEDAHNLFVAIKTDPFAPTSILETKDINGDQVLEDIEDNDDNMDDMLENDFKNASLQIGNNDFEMSDPEELEKQVTTNHTTISSFFKKCDTTSSPTSSTPIPLPPTSPPPPLILSNSNTTTTHQEIVYNNNGYSIKSSINNEYTANYNNLEQNGSTKEESVTSTCSPPPSQIIEMSTADGSFTEVEKIPTSSGSASVSSTSTFVSFETSNFSNGTSSF